MNCLCMLCSNSKVSSVQKTESHTRHFPKPTILCQYIEYWRSMWNICCCTMHANCDFRKFGQCGCPKCCLCTQTASGINPSMAPCVKCASKDKCYHPCNHLPGICKTYLASVTKQQDTLRGEEEHMDTN